MIQHNCTESTKTKRKEEKTLQLKDNGKSTASNYSMVPLEDLAWLQNYWKQSSVVKLWLICWQTDPYGTRWLQINHDLSKTAFAEAKKILSNAGLFMFKRDTSTIDSRSTVCWMVLNLHGSKVFWQSERSQSASADNGAADIASADNLTASTDTTTAHKNNTTASAVCISTESLTQQGFQNASISSSISFQYPPQYRALPAATLPEEETKNFSEESSLQIPDISEANNEEINSEVSNEIWDGLERQLEAREREYLEQSVLTPKPTEDCGGHSLTRENTLIDGGKKCDRSRSALLNWLVETKIPSMQLDDPPRNLEAYAHAMLKRDSDALNEEFNRRCDTYDRQSNTQHILNLCHQKQSDWQQFGREVHIFNLSTNLAESSAKTIRVKLVCCYDRTVSAEEFLDMEMPEIEDSDRQSEQVILAKAKAHEIINKVKEQQRQKKRERMQRLAEL